MSVPPESASTDLVAVACVVESSLLLASEWSRILLDYVFPLLKRLNELHPSHQFRLAFVTYGAADTRPKPVLARRYFAPLSHVSKVLREEPSKLGIGQTNSGSGRGLSALEGLVAAIELFDVLMVSANYPPNHAQTQSSQKDNRSLISHLLHIAASPPDNAQRPHCNTLQHLDSVNWDSIPAELKKRKINLSLISLRKIPQFQDLQSSVAGSAVQSPWFNVRAPHVLLLAGFPTPQKTSTKRQTDALLSDQSPDTKRQKVVADPVSKTSSASPALSSARIPSNQRSQQPVSSQAPQPPPTTVPAPAPNPSPAQPIMTSASVPASTPTTATPLPPSAPSLPAPNHETPAGQVAVPAAVKFAQMVDLLKGTEKEIEVIESRISSARNAGLAVTLAGLQKELEPKVQLRDQLRTIFKQHYQKVFLAKEAQNTQAGTAGSVQNGSTEAGPSTHPQPPNAPAPSTEQSMGSMVEEHKPVVSDSQILAHFWQSRGGTVSAPNGSNPQAGPSQTQSLPTANPEAAAQMQIPTEKIVVRPQGLGPSPQPSGTASHETAVGPHATNGHTSVWHGMCSWVPKFNGQVGKEVQIHMIALAQVPIPSDIHGESWPKNLTLNTCKEPLKDAAELQSWLKRHKAETRLLRFLFSPRPPDGAANNQRFHGFCKFLSERRLFVYAGWQWPSGKFSYNIVIVPVGGSFLGALFPQGVPDLPGSGNILDPPPPIEEAKPQPPRGVTFPPAILARLQGLEPAKQKQVLAHFLRAQQQEQLRRQQLQQAQQSHTTSSQTLNTPGMSMLPNTYNMVPNVPAGLPANVNGLVNSGMYNTGGGTVNYEMLQSFMQRNAEGSTSQGMNPGQMP